MPAGDVHEYRTLRAAQDVRYEQATGLPVGDTARQEYKDFFGVGDCTTSPVEVRWTLRRFLEGRKDDRRDEPELSVTEDEPAWCITPESAFVLPGADLAVLAAAGDSVAAAEIARRVAKRAAKRRGLSVAA